MAALNKNALSLCLLWTFTVRLCRTYPFSKGACLTDGRGWKRKADQARAGKLQGVRTGGGDVRGNSNINRNKKMSYKLTVVEYLMYMRHLIIVLFNPFNNPMN